MHHCQLYVKAVWWLSVAHICDHEQKAVICFPYVQFRLSALSMQQWDLPAMGQGEGGLYIIA